MYFGEHLTAANGLDLLWTKETGAAMDWFFYTRLLNTNISRARTTWKRIFSTNRVITKTMVVTRFWFYN